MKKLLLFIGVWALLGAGCSGGIQPLAGFLQDAEKFSEDSPQQISSGVTPGLTIPAAAGSVATSGRSNFTTITTNSVSERGDILQNTAPKRVNVSLPKPSVIGAAANYGKNLNQFQKSGAYFQFVKCQANPGYMVIKKGAAFMLDNRDAIAHTIKLNDQEFRLPPYGYAITSAQVASSTKAQYLICDNATTAGILVQP